MYKKYQRNKPSVYQMTHNNKIYDLLYFKGIIEDYNIKLESIKNEKVNDENLKIVVSVIK